MLALWLAEHGEDAHHAADAAHHAAEHAHHGSKVPELPNLLGVVHNILYGTNPELATKLDNFAAKIGLADPNGTPFTALETLIFAAVVIIALIIFFVSA